MLNRTTLPWDTHGALVPRGELYNVQPVSPSRMDPFRAHAHWYEGSTIL
jgi:hypothetical protein